MTHRVVKFLSALTIVPAVLLASGCTRGGDADTDSQSSPAAESTAAGVSMDMEFADELNIDLDAMTRLPTGLYYEDINQGSGLGARDGHVLNVHYTGRLTTGEIFDENTDGEGFSFQLGRQQVIQGWEQGIQGMRIGGKRRLVVPPSLGYGQRGRPGAIPPSATLVFDVELLDIRL
jgi:FKBP-type peptidyl-prolyl cis-trans isomerase